MSNLPTDQGDHIFFKEKGTLVIIFQINIWWNAIMPTPELPGFRDATWGRLARKADWIEPLDPRKTMKMSMMMKKTVKTWEQILQIENIELENSQANFWWCSPSRTNRWICLVTAFNLSLLWWMMRLRNIIISCNAKKLYRNWRRRIGLNFYWFS